MFVKTCGELNKEYDVVRSEYYKLRDAKSDGCCVGKSIPEILAYDELIMEQANRLRAINTELQEVHTLIEFLQDCKEDYLEVLEEKAADDEEDWEGCSWSPEKLGIVKRKLNDLIMHLS